MLTLAHDQLCVELLDPVADRPLLGPRFCWGGLVWQVHDTTLGPLLTGPEWPSPTPAPFNAQGLPESFRHRTRAGRPLTWHGDRGVALGVGELALDASGNVFVSAPCEWVVRRAEGSLEFSTSHAAAGFSYQLVRTLATAHRTLRSGTVLTNTSDARLVLEWFAHPFFALTDGLARVRLPEGTTLADNPGFVLTGGDLTQRRRFTHLQAGHMDFLHLPKGGVLAMRIDHPRLEYVDFATSFAPGECVIWGNSATFSVEPYQTLDLAPGETGTWELRYEFGPATRPAEFRRNPA